MNTIIVDTNIILSHPEILSQYKDKFKIIVPDTVFNEYNSVINRNIHYKKISDNIKKLQSNSGFIIGNSSDIKVLDYKKYDVGLSDMRTLSFINKYIISNKSEEIYFITNDKRLEVESKLINIKTLNSKEFFSRIEYLENEDYIILKNENKKLKRKKRAQFIVNLVIALVSSILASTLTRHWDTVSIVINDIFLYINIWGTILLIPIIGFCLFVIRSRFRLTYGIIEFVIGTTTGILVFYPNFDILNMSVVKTLQLMGGLYIIVRSLDNITKGLKKSPFARFSNKWSNIFPN